MNILLVTESYWPNIDGGALFERRLVLGLLDRGHSVSVWAPGTKSSSYVETDHSYFIYREKSVGLLINPAYRVSFWPFWTCRSVIHKVQPHCIHVHNAGPMGIAAIVWSRLLHIPIVATNHFMPENLLLNLWGGRYLLPRIKDAVWSYITWFHNRCDLVTSPTPTAVDLLVSHGLRSTAHAITNGVDTAIFRPGLDTSRLKKQKQYSLPADKPILLYLGRVNREKRIDTILRALPHIRQGRDVHLLIAGEGNDRRRLERLCRGLMIEESVTFLGYVPEDDKPALYNLADVFLIASPAELQSIVVLEAMSSGLPIIAADAGALKELCRDGENGYVFELDCPNDLAQKVLELMSEQRDLDSFGERSRRIVENDHDTIVPLRLYEDAYQGAIKLRGKKLMRLCASNRDTGS